MCDLKKQEKWPNIDGYLHFLKNSDKTPSEELGLFEAQMKALPKNHNLKFNLSTDFINYANDTANSPVLLLCVDTEKEAVYWIYCDRQFCNLDKDKLKQKTITINLKPTDVITKNNKSYIEQWEKIIVRHKETNQTAKLNKDYLESLLFIKENTSNISQTQDEKYKEIHAYLDGVNYFLDFDFKIIKTKLLFSRVWKLGFAYKVYENNKLSYSLFPILEDTNDLMIKKIDGNIRNLLSKQKIPSYISHYRDNPIKENSKLCAIEFIEKHIETILKNRNLLEKTKNKEIINEFLYEFADYFYEQLNLEKSGEYSVLDIDNNLKFYLPIWIEELLKLKKIPLIPKMVVAPISSFIQETDEEKSILADLVQKRLDNKDYAKCTFKLENSRYSFSMAIELIEAAKNIGLDKVLNNIAKGEKNLSSRTSYWLWEIFSLDELDRNLKSFFEKLPEVYDQLIKDNFPLIYDNLNFFSEFNHLVITYDAKEVYGNEFSDGPSIHYYGFQNDSIEKPKIEIYFERDCPHELSWEKIIINKKEYDPAYLVNSGLDFIYHDLPLMNYSYKLLKKNLEKYFEKLKNFG